MRERQRIQRTCETWGQATCLPPIRSHASQWLDTYCAWLARGSACGYTARQVKRIGRIISTCLLNNNQEAMHIYLSVILWLFQSCLLENAVQRARRLFMTRMTCNRDAPPFGGMLVLAMTTFRSHAIPTVRFNQFDNVKNFHYSQFSANDELKLVTHSHLG